MKTINKNVEMLHCNISTNKTKKAFTLVELIIVITILAILATIAFVSFKSYFGNARDSVRVSDIKTIHNGLSLLKVKTDIFPKPENPLEIKV
jgi:prepilin-type N-terminal cleavage/methylation domain-containing protein